MAKSCGDAVLIRPCRQADWPAVLVLLRQLWPGTRLNEAACRRTYLRGLRSSTQVYLCATQGGKLIGFGSLTFQQTFWQAAFAEAEIDELVVDEGQRDRGVGALLLAGLLTAAAKHGCRRVELKSAGHRTGAHRFYERQGFALLRSKRFAREL